MDSGRRLFWTCMVAVLPLFWVAGGYHLWRKVCPLGFFATLAQRFGKAGDRKLGGRWHTHALLFQVVVMGVALAARLLAINGGRLPLAGFLVAVTALAVGLGFVFRGKTWCNFLCPVGLVEKVYTEPFHRPEQPNSQCARCTGCRKVCPDIDIEKSYWKEAALPSRSHAYGAWPGLVLGFYAYFWLETGSWDSYFDGSWATGVHSWSTLLDPGFFFLPQVPRLAAVPLTLAVAGLGSAGLFLGIEKLLGRHRTLMLAGFAAFNLFYVFAGQPTIRMGPAWVGWLVTFAVVMSSTLILAWRWTRTEEAYVRGTFARRMAKKDRSKRVVAYRDTLKELALEGVLTRDRLELLDSVREQLRITDEEHDDAVAKLDAARLFEPDALASAEERLQVQQFRRELSAAITAAAQAGASVDELLLRRLGREHGLTTVRQDEVFAELTADALDALTVESVASLVSLARIAAAARSVGGPLAELLIGAARAEAEENVAHIDAVVYSLAADARPESVPQALAELATGTSDATGLDEATGVLGRIARAVRGQADAELDVVLALQEIELLAKLDPRDLLRVAPLAESRDHVAGTTLCREQEDGDEVLLVRSGEVDVHVQGKHIRTLGPGSGIGELAVLDPAPRSATVTARTDTVCLVLPGAEFRELAAAHPSLSQGLLRELTRRLRTA